MIARIGRFALSLFLSAVLCGGNILSAQSPLETGLLEPTSVNAYQILVVGHHGPSWIGDGFQEPSHFVAQPPKRSGPPMPKVPSLQKHPKVKMWLWISAGAALGVLLVLVVRDGNPFPAS